MPDSTGSRRARLFGVLAVVLIVVVAVAVRLRSGTGPVSAPTAPAAPARDHGSSLLVLSGRDGSPLSSAILTLPDGNSTLSADADGRIALEAGIRGKALLRGPGHLGRRLDLPPPDGELRVFLLPAAAVEVLLRDGGDQPVAGVAVVLEPASDPVDSDALLAVPIVRERKSGADGRVLWPELVPERPYRWRVTSAHRVEADPPEFTEPDLFAATPKGGAFASRPFEIPAGQTLRYKARVRAGASVTGIVETPLPDRTALIRIYAVRPYTSGPKLESGPAERTVTKLEKVVLPGDGGRFLLSDLQAGRKKLTAYWTSSQGLHFASVQFSLQPGEDRDLGLIRGQEGQSFALTIRVSGRDAIPKEVQERGLKARVRFYSRRLGGVGTPIEQWLLLPVDEAIVLTGLAEGSLLLEADIHEAGRMPGVQWTSRKAKFNIPEESSGELTLAAQANIRFTLKAVYPAGAAAGGELNAFVLPVGGPDSRQGVQCGFEVPPFKPQAGDSPGTASTTIQAPVGEYLIRVFSADPGKQASPGYFGEGQTRIAVFGPNEATVTLGPGNTLSGRAVDSQGLPERRLLRLLVSPYHGPNDHPVRVVSPDTEGRFVIKGVPPNQTMIFLFSEDAFRSGPAGTETQIEIRMTQ